MNKSEKIKLLKLLKEKEKRMARNRHISFMDYCWMEKQNKFLKGFHTDITCKEIDLAIENYRNGISTFLLLSIPPRHGKSQIVSRYLPPHFMAEFPGTETILSSYSTDLATTFSEQGRALVKTDKFKDLYPTTHIALDSSAKSNWKLCFENDIPSSLRAVGLTASINGKGYHLGVLDDYIKNRQEAENPEQRERIWQCFTNDFLTRRAPVSITIIVATQWHWGDINGRIRMEMKKNPDFPKFKVLAFPAKAKDYKGEGEYPDEFLFQSRFGKRYYYEQYASLGKYNAAALLDCNPRIKGGELLNTDNIEWLDPDDSRVVGFNHPKWRILDLAHSHKERAGSDPDWTAGTLLSFVPATKDDPVPHLWVFHVYRCREGAVKRDSIIKRWASKDGSFVRQAIETSLDSKDAFNYLQKSMPEINWHKINLHGKGDKLVRATPLEPIFEAPNHVHVVRGSWNDDWLNEIETFTGSGKEHDDMLDNLSAGYIMCLGSGYNLTGEQRAALRARNKRR